MNNRLENEVSILIEKLLMTDYKFCPQIYMDCILSGSVLIKDCFMKCHITILLNALTLTSIFIYMYAYTYYINTYV